MDATNKFPTFFDNTLRIKNEADSIALTGDKILRIRKVKEKFSFRVGQKIKASGNGRWKEGRNGKVVHRFKLETGYNQYIVAWDDTPKKFLPYLSPTSGEWTKKIDGMECWPDTEREKDLIPA